MNYGGVKPELCDTDVWSPKSVHFHPNGKKYYINSLEGCRTMVYDARTNKKLAVIHHKFTPANAYLWAKESGFFPFHHYTNKKNLNTFWGRPVESTFRTVAATCGFPTIAAVTTSMRKTPLPFR